MMLICLDSSIIIAWMQGEQRTTEEHGPDVWGGVCHIMDNLSAPVKFKSSAGNSKGMYALVSSIVLAEVLDHTKHVRGYEEFDNRLSNFYVESVDARIAKMAAEYRELWKLKIPDALHTATAIACRAEYLVTTDKRDILKHATCIHKITKGQTQVVAPPLPE